MIDASGPQVSYEVGAPSAVEDEAIAEEMPNAVPLPATPPVAVPPE
jgi:hypothetical protein